MTNSTGETREFPFADVLTVTTGRLLSRRNMGGLHELLDWMTGQSLMTHQLPRAAEACRPTLLAAHPWLAGIEPPATESTGELLAWLDAVEAEHPGDVEVPQAAGWEHRDPIADLAGSDRVVGVVVPDENGEPA